MEKIKVNGSHVVDSLESETGHLYKGRIIILSPGNVCISGDTWSLKIRGRVENVHFSLKLSNK